MFYMSTIRIQQDKVATFAEKHLQVFIAHSEAQLVLQRLGLPFISTDGAAPASHAECITVDDDDGTHTDPHADVLIAWEDPVNMSNVSSPGNAIHQNMYVDHHSSASHDSRTGTDMDEHMIGADIQSQFDAASSTRRSRPSRGPNRSSLSDSASARSHDTGHISMNMDSQELAPDTQSQSQSQSGSGTLVCTDDLSKIHRRNAKRWTTTALKELTQQDYASMQPAQCVMVASKTSRALQIQTERTNAATKQCKALKRLNSRQNQLLEKRQKLLEDAQRKSGLEIVSIGRTGKRMSTQSAFAIGVRRNMSNIAAADFGSTILMDISHQRVTRSELKTCAAMLCRMRSLCASVVSHESIAASSEPASDLPVTGLPGCNHKWQLTTVSFRCDATNSSIWRREKLHVLDVDFAWVKDFGAVRTYDGDKAIAVARCLPLGIIVS